MSAIAPTAAVTSDPSGCAAPMRVVHVVLSLDVGGLERIVVSLGGRAASLQQSASVICLERRGDLAEPCESLGATVYCLNKRPGLRPGMVGRVAQILCLIQPDVVHTHQIAALLYAGRAAHRLGIPVVHTEHGKHYARRLRTRVLGRVAARYASRFFCVSRDIAAEVAECRIVPPSKLAVVHNGIDLDDQDHTAAAMAVRAEMGIPIGNTVIGTVGRLCDVKRQDVLIRTLARIRRHSSSVSLLLVGDGPRRKDLVKLAWRLGLADVVHFAGYQSQPRRFLAAMDLFALSSASEGMPLAVLEAWAAHKPVVAFAVGGLPEMIEHRRSGILVESGHETELAEAMFEVISNRKLASDLATGGRQRVEMEFSLARTALRYDGEYRAVCRAPGPDG